MGWAPAERTAHPRLRWLIRRCRPLGVSGHVGFRAFNRSGSKGLTQDTRHGKRQTTAKLDERDCQQCQPPIECIRRNFYPATFSLLTDLDRTLEVSLYCVSGHWLGRYLSQLRAMCGRLRVVKGSITSQRWSEQPCVRPISAAHRAAGHNALRGSDPGQKLAFNDALAHVGCPDHRVDRFCITCCPPFPTVTSHRCRRDLVSVASSIALKR